MKKTISIALILAVCWITAFSQVDLEDGLVRHYPFESDANDKSPNAGHGTLVGDASFGAGCVGNALVLDGTRDYVDLGTGLQIGNTFSVAVWVNICR